MGLFDVGLFDFNGDGESSLGEEFMGFMIFNEVFIDKSGEEDEDESEDDEDEDED